VDLTPVEYTLFKLVIMAADVAIVDSVDAAIPRRQLIDGGREHHILATHLVSRRGSRNGDATRYYPPSLDFAAAAIPDWGARIREAPRGGEPTPTYFRGGNLVSNLFIAFYLTMTNLYLPSCKGNDRRFLRLYLR
jgi:hypothetical protein